MQTSAQRKPTSISGPSRAVTYSNATCWENVFLQERARATGQPCYWDFPSATWAACWPQCFADTPVMSQLGGTSQKELETQRWHLLRLKNPQRPPRKPGKKKRIKEGPNFHVGLWQTGMPPPPTTDTHKMRALEFKYTIRKEPKCKTALKFPMCSVNGRNGFQVFQSHQGESC